MKRKVTLISTAVFLVVVLSFATTLLLIESPVGAKSVMKEPILDTTIDKMQQISPIVRFREAIKALKDYIKEFPQEVESLVNQLDLNWYFESSDKRKNYLCYYEKSEFFELEEMQLMYLSYSG